MTNLLRVIKPVGMFAVILMLLLPPFPAQASNPLSPAATIYVNTTADQFDTDTSHCSLREAIYTANNALAMPGCTLGSVGSDTITLPAGNYVLTRTAAELDTTCVTGDLDIAPIMTLLPPGSPEIPVGIIINGAGAGSTIISANWGPGFFDRILDVTAGWSASINNLTITGGHTIDMTAANPSEAHGGGVRNYGILNLSNVVIEGNQTGEAGGSKAQGGSGGGIYIGSGATLFMENSTLRNNVTGDSHVQSWAGPGGGLYNAGTATILQSTINGNLTGDGTAYSGSGGSGGGIYNSGTLDMTNSTVYGNITGNGDSGPASNGGSGAGIMTTWNMTLESVTIAYNIAGSADWDDTTHGGGVYIHSTPELTASIHNTLIAGNQASDGLGDDCYTAGEQMLYADYSLIGDSNSCTISGANNSADVNAHLLPLASNGGPTQTAALSTSPASPALDAGDPLDHPDTDQRGCFRPIAWHGGEPFPDIGAFEYGCLPYFLPLIVKPLPIT